jgi:hypothetical protein
MAPLPSSKNIYGAASENHYAELEFFSSEVKDMANSTAD